MEGSTTEHANHTGGSEGCDMQISPGNTKYWTPVCNPSIKPSVGQWFLNLDNAIEFYAKYAGKVGFDIRRSSEKKDRQGKILMKYVLCSHEGFKQPTILSIGVDGSRGETGTDVIRRRTSNRVGCNARIVFKRVGSGGFVVFSLEERHNHCMCSEVSKTFLRVKRKLDLGHQTFITNCAKANIGPIKSFKLYKEMVGDYSKIGATSVDFCNFRRDLLAYIETGDAHLILAKYRQKKEVCPKMYFEYDVDEYDHLCRVFWADPEARRNFARFGDAMSFDATYSTNRYSLVFVPFTGVDHHKKCITFAIGLISKEDVKSYVWLLENFKKCMGHVPQLTVTDQDPAMKSAVAQVFESTRHRFCMWHIMTKVSEKVGSTLAKNEEFRRALNAVVWNEKLKIEEFEVRWHHIMEDYGLSEHKWFKQMFEVREFWIPAYFHNVYMGGLLRTTSRSEAENSVFGSYTSQHASLVEFFLQFEAAIDTQRHKQAKLNADCESKFPEMKTPLKIERHTATIYTIAIFYDVQEEIYAGCVTSRIISKMAEGGCVTSRIISKMAEGDSIHFVVEDGDGGLFDVYAKNVDLSFDCTCRMFQRVGLLCRRTCRMFQRVGLLCRHVFVLLKDSRLLCRHVFVLLKDSHVDIIPSQYIVARWTRAYDGEVCRGDNISVVTDPNSALTQVWNEFYNCVGRACGNTDRLVELATLLKAHSEISTNSNNAVTPSTAKVSVIHSFCGSPKSSDVVVQPPNIAKNKGSGKRLKSIREKVAEKATKAKRLCRTCKQFAHHDSRNCPEA
ncbi:protein FAR1-RELATED SEQUENCE 5-like [Ipomoea triloba]|uniref:protein FAR1-RELATED SEQUENCE 5-like n=1 Tax=Ipomoea triloba TaxID=35885 RepID=UPI00125DC960|nr:protein FAR1-RELATED SEQUENCE 5-like [Ipomoea triloba]